MTVDDEEFDALCYAYRTAPASDPAAVVARFEELKKAIREMIEEERESAYRSRSY